MIGVIEVEIEYTYRQLIQAPMYAVALSCKVLGNKPVIFFEVSMAGHVQIDDIEILMVETGNGVSAIDLGKYLGTVQDPRDDKVWHVFDVKG